MKLKRAIIILLSCATLLSMASCGKSKTEGIKINRATKTGETIEKMDSSMLLDAFDGFEISFAGISPFCEPSMSVSGCSQQVQSNVSFSTERRYFANGEKVKVTAKINSSATGTYRLLEESKEFTVENMPEYITSVDGLDLTALYKERDDFVTAESAKAVGTNYLFGESFSVGQDGIWGLPIFEIVTSEIENVYIVSLKSNKLANVTSSYSPINKICFIYHLVCSNERGEKYNAYINLSAENVVKYPDGTVKWGTESADSLDFQVELSTKSIDDIVSKSIISLSADYDTKKIQ